MEIDETFGHLGRMLDITFDDKDWSTNSKCDLSSADTGLDRTGFIPVESGIVTGVYTGDFQVPSDCTYSTPLTHLCYILYAKIMFRRTAAAYGETANNRHVHEKLFVHVCATRQNQALCRMKWNIFWSVLYVMSLSYVPMSEHRHYELVPCVMCCLIPE